MSAAMMLPAEVTTRWTRIHSGFSKPVVRVKKDVLNLARFISKTSHRIGVSLYGKVKVLQRGISISVEKTAYIMAMLYSLSGFEKLSKSILATFKLLIYIVPGTSSIFKEFLKTIEAQKDVYYATLWINSTAEFIHEVKDETGKTVRDLKRKMRRYTVQIPRQANGKRDWVKVCYAIGNFIEFGKFLDKNKVIAFNAIKKIAHKIGSSPLFALHGKMYNLERIPVVSFFYKFLCQRPKDAFMFIGISNEIWRYSNELWKHLKNPMKSPMKSKLDFVLKSIGAVGKICLISLGNVSYLWQFKVIDFITQNSSLFKFIVDHHRSQRDAKRPKVVKIASPVNVRLALPVGG